MGWDNDISLPEGNEHRGKLFALEQRGGWNLPFQVSLRTWATGLKAWLCVCIQGERVERKPVFWGQKHAEVVVDCMALQTLDAG